MTDVKTDYCEHCGTLFDQPASELAFGNVRLTAKTLIIRDEEYHLPRQPHQILRTMFRRSPISKEALFGAVWGGESDTHIKTLDVVVHRLRVLLAEIGADFRIVTIRSFGYRFQKIDEPSSPCMLDIQGMRLKSDGGIAPKGATRSGNTALCKRLK